jgi:hypothetical protein
VGIFRRFGDQELERQAFRESSHVGVLKTQNPKGVCSEQRRASKTERMHRFSQSLCQGIKGTCGFVQRVPTGAQRAILAQKKNDPETERSVDPAEVGGLHHVVPKPTSFMFAYHK